MRCNGNRHWQSERIYKARIRSKSCFISQGTVWGGGLTKGGKTEKDASCLLKYKLPFEYFNGPVLYTLNDVTKV